MGKYLVVSVMISVVAGPVMASDDDSPGGLQEIVVTAQRRAENLQSVPIAVTALTSETLKDSNIQSGMDLDKVVPSLMLQANNGTVTPFLRGIGSSLSPVGNEASVATFIDGVYYSRLSPALYQLNDVERVEVLKGPQGTLFGRNSSGGLIQFITSEPTVGQAPSLKASAGYSSYTTNDESLYVATGLGSAAAFSISGINHQQKNGWGTNVTTGQDVWVDSSQAARAKLIVQATESTKIVLTAAYSRDNGDVGLVGHYFDHVQGSFATGAPLPQLSFYDMRNGTRDYSTTYLSSFALRVEQDVGFATLKNITSFNHIEQQFAIDTDFDAPFLQAAALPSTGQDLQEELQLVSTPGSDLSWTGGLYFLNQGQGYKPARFTGALFEAYSGGIDNAYVSYASQRIKSYAEYGQASYKFIEKATFTLGLRYTKDELFASGVQGAEIPIGGPTVVDFPGTNLRPEASFDKVTWHGAFDYQFTPDVMGYVSVSRGYKAGTFNILPLTSVVPARPEVLDAYEIGAKSEFFDHRFRFNAAAFFYNLQDPQVELVPAPAITITSNAKKAQTFGLDFDADAQLLEHLKAHLGFSYLHARYKDYEGAEFISPNPVSPYGNLGAVGGNASGNTMVRSPTASFNVGAQYVIPIPMPGSWGVSGNYAYNTGFFWDADNRNKEPAYGLLDAQVSYALPGDFVKLRVWGSNLTGVHYYTTAYELAGPGGDVGYPGAPRMVGVSADFKFH